MMNWELLVLISLDVMISLDATAEIRPPGRI